jgi:hypothetical protein
MRQLATALGIATLTALAVTGCAATASSGSGKPSAAASSSASASTSAENGLSGLTSGGSGAPAKFLVDGTFSGKGAPAKPLAGTITFRAASNVASTKVTVGSSGKFSLGLGAGTYSATGQAEDGGSACSAAATVIVHAGQTTQVSLVCRTS